MFYVVYAHAAGDEFWHSRQEMQTKIIEFKTSVEVEEFYEKWVGRFGYVPGTAEHRKELAASLFRVFRGSEVFVKELETVTVRYVLREAP